MIDFQIERHSDIPLRSQIRSTIEYAIACGDLPVGSPLPTVRQLAAQLEVAPMTISQVYADLKRSHLIEGRKGAGTFVIDSLATGAADAETSTKLRQKMDELIAIADQAGLNSDALCFLLASHHRHRQVVRTVPKVIVVGLFPKTTESYAQDIRDLFRDRMTVISYPLARLESEEPVRIEASTADAIVTFVSLKPRLQELLPGAVIVTPRFVARQSTLDELAALPPDARIATVAGFPGFGPVLETGVNRGASQCSDIIALSLASEDLVRQLADRTVIIYASGAEAVLSLAPANIHSFEYLNTPDPTDLAKTLKRLTPSRVSSS